MKKRLSLAILSILTISVLAQQKVALHSNGTTTIIGGSSPFVDAYNASQDGDTIYLPGAVLSIPSNINKRLVIYGAGHYPDSTIATGQTILSGSLVLWEDADSLFLEGVELTGNLLFSNNHEISHVMISRCKIQTMEIPGNQATPSTFNTFRECVFTGSINIPNAAFCVLTNNIIKGQITSGNNNAFFNNIFLFSAYYYNYVFNSVHNSSISNNVFCNSFGSVLNTYSGLNTLANNIFATSPAPGSNTFIDNYSNVDITTLFVNQSGYDFDYSHDYHLNSPELYPGNNGSEVGLYGGLFPYKTAAVPSNPHIISQSIPTMTTEDGILEVNITVSAQQE